MDPTIIISSPASGASVGPNFGAGGAVTPTNAGVLLTFKNATNTKNGSTTAMHGQWSFQFQNVPAGTGYTLTASISDKTGVSDQHNNITVE